MNYDLIAIDIDGTMIRPDKTLSPGNRDAIARALDAGLRVVPATGRGWRESVIALDQLGDVANRLDWGIFNTGACIAKIDGGESTDLAEFEPHLALELIEHMRPLPEAVLVYLDRHTTGLDYLVTGDGALTENTERWLTMNDLRYKQARQPTPNDLHGALRVGLVAQGERAFRVAEGVQRDFAERVDIHAFAGVPTADGEERVFIAEIFAKGVSKWRGISVLTDKWNIPAHRVAAIGDEINDLAMLEHAGLGIAMGNAVDQAKAAADIETKPNTEDGVAHAIDQILSGAW